MIATSPVEHAWGRNVRPHGTNAWAMPPKDKPAAPVLRPPYAPDSSHILRFWLAGPLTLLLFIPALGAGIFGAPLMIPGYIFAWRMLRSGQDSYHDFARGGFLTGLVTLFCFLPFGGGALYAFGLLFGPLMAMTFRWIAGSWRETVPPPVVSPSATMPDLARIPRTA